jgi:hypothetical protein
LLNIEYILGCSVRNGGRKPFGAVNFLSIEPLAKYEILFVLPGQLNRIET